MIGYPFATVGRVEAAAHTDPAERAHERREATHLINRRSAELHRLTPHGDEAPTPAIAAVVTELETLWAIRDSIAVAEWIAHGAQVGWEPGGGAVVRP